MLLTVLTLLVGIPLMNDDKPAAMKKDLVFARTFDAPIEQVWKAWTDEAEVRKWWGPIGFSCPVAKMDVREGGTTLVCMRASKEFGGKDMYSTWAYSNVVKHQTLDYIHNLSDEHGKKVNPKDLGMPADFPVDQRHLVTFKDAGQGKTEITITEYGWTPGQMMEFSKKGMNQCLDKMAANFKK